MTERVDVRHLYEGGKLYKVSYRYGVRYYSSRNEVSSEISRLKKPVVERSQMGHGQKPGSRHLLPQGWPHCQPLHFSPKVNLNSCPCCS